MGVKCEISLQKRSEERYKPGDLVNGFIKYTIDTDTQYKDIVISLKGFAVCRWSEGSNESRRHYVGTQELFILQKSILNKNVKESALVNKGEYVTPFDFFLPDKLPSSFEIDKVMTGKIKYYVRIKFIPPGPLNLIKKFKKRITVENKIVEPILPEQNIIYGLQKEFKSFFKISNGTINLKANVSNSRVQPKDKVEIICEIENNSNVNINRITTNLIEIVTGIANGGQTNKIRNKFKECKSTIEKIDPGLTVTCGVVVPTLESMYTLQNCKVIRRDYEIVFVVKLPLPYPNETLKIPLEIGYKYSDDIFIEETENCEPPSYWEIMEEEKVSLAND